MKVGTPFFHLVPTDIVANLGWRKKVHQRVIDDPSYADVIWHACAADPLFYICGFGWTYDPRLADDAPFYGKLPFLLYPFQQEALLEIIRAIGNHDLLIKKSRDMGGSWLCILAYEWAWHFYPRQSFLMGSRNENYVDNAENPKSLFWKIDFFHRNLPPWLMPAGFNLADHRRKMHLTNPANESVFDGESTTAQFARGDRRTGVMLDEFAAVEEGGRVLTATRDATRSRLFNSTPLGINNAYYDVHETNIKKLQLHWSEHPFKSIGLYTTAKDGSLKILDKEGYPDDYKPILDGQLRSIQYDIEEERTGSAREMAQEWNIDFLGSGSQYFLAAAVQEAIRRCARPPITIGDLEYDSVTGEPIRFRESETGRIRLWCLLDKNNNFQGEHKVVLGVDCSAGTGASNSCLCAYDVVTNEKVLEYVNPFIRPEELAKQAVAIARWLGGAYIIWESNGPGRQFGSRVEDLKYSNFHLRRREESLSKKVSQIPGWASTKQGKLVLMGNYRAAIEKAKCMNRSKPALEETLEYIFDPDGGVSHSRSKSKDDPSGARANHGDRVMADALAWHAMTERHNKPVEPKKPSAPIGSLAWRIQQKQKDKPNPNRELIAADGW